MIVPISMVQDISAVIIGNMEDRESVAALGAKRRDIEPSFRGDCFFWAVREYGLDFARTLGYPTRIFRLLNQ